MLLAVRLGQRESHLDWLDVGRDLTRRGLRCPWLLVSDGAPGLIKAIDELWPEADRGRCAVHKLRNVVAKLPDRPGLHQAIKDQYWAALDEATIRPMPSSACAHGSPSWSDPSRAPPLAWRSSRPQSERQSDWLPRGRRSPPCRCLELCS